MKDSRILLGLVSLALVILIAGGVLLFISMGGMVREMGEIRGRILSLDLELKNMKILENFLTETVGGRERIAGSFVGEHDLVRFIEDLEDGGERNGVRVRVGSAALASGVTQAGPTFMLEAEGSFASIFRYMVFLENIPYEIILEDVDMTSISQDGKKIWKGSFIVRLLSYES